jgi:transcriptional regulator with XRE-family HTH domain
MAEKRPDNIYGKRLREARKRYNASQTTLGVAAGLDESGVGSLISRYENGIHQPELGRQRRFARALGIPLKYFYTEDDEEARLTAESCHSEDVAKKFQQIKGRTSRKRKRKRT